MIFYKLLIIFFYLLIYLIIFFFCLKFFIFSYWFDGLIFYNFKFYDFFYGNFDGLSLILIFLTGLIILLCYIVIWNNKLYNYYFLLLNILFIFLIGVFSLTNLFLFYIFFEATLVPMYLFIGFLGSRIRKITAAYRFFLYTFFGSIFFFLVIIVIFFFFGTFDFYKILNLISFSIFFKKIFWVFSFITFAVKMPLFPFHNWLPEAHSEAPTVGSIILASILLKLGPFGIIKFINVLFLEGLFFFRPILYLFCILGLYYTSLSAIRQLDIKRIVAYSSIGHMSLVMLGILSYNFEGYLGAFFLIMSHGFISAGLFLIVGFIYDRYLTRNLLYFGGLVQLNPKLSISSFLFLLGNFAFPGTMNFLAELLIVIGTFSMNYYICFLVCLSSLFVLVYNLYFFSRIFFGLLANYIDIYNFDIQFREIILSLVLIIPVYLYGIFPTNIYFFFDKMIKFCLFI